MNSESKTLPRLCFIGPMVGRHPGYVTTQGLMLSRHFSSTTYPVLAVSDVRNRYGRLLDIVRTLICHGWRYDIQCLEVYGGPSFVVEEIASWLGARLNQRVVMVLHGGAMPEFMRRFPRWTRRVLSRADLLVTPSTFLSRALAAHGFAARVIPNVIDLSGYPFRHRQKVDARLFWMRTFDHLWNPEMAVRVLAGVKRVIPDATLVMAGQDNGLQSEVRRLAVSLGVSDSVRFAGFLDMQAKVREGSAADIYINTNHVDNMPVAIVEAWALGMPVVSTNVGGVPDLVEHEQTGLLVPDNDVEAMVQAVHRIVTAPELAAALSLNGRRQAERSSWDKVRMEWEMAFAEVLKS